MKQKYSLPKNLLVLQQLNGRVKLLTLRF